MKILLELDKETGNITDASGVHIGVCYTPRGFEVEEVKSKESGLDYAKAGYTSDDLVKLKASGVI